MKILILGATGRTGKHILEAALARKIKTNCLVRSTKKIRAFIPNDSFTVYVGSPDKMEDLEKAAKGCDTIISVLNISRTSDFPWSTLRTPTTFLSDVMKNILTIANAENSSLNSVISCSAWGVHETIHHIPWWFRLMINYSNIGAAYEDHERQENLLSKSENVKWVIVRPVGLINRKKVKRICVSFDNNPKPNMTISRRELAQFILDIATNERDYWYQKPTISSSFFG
ncbi:MAG: hypothetical protein EA362_13570 [Saprospirales bacterium]|nr:MAG: hypothetical protein EA362_13570 [Saprospirales bacterium]